MPTLNEMTNLLFGDGEPMQGATFSLEEAIAYINDDELVEVTPSSVRLRKRFLDPHERKKAKRKDG